MENLPESIYLNLGDVSEIEDFKGLSEVTWSEDDVQGMNVKYVRTDAFIEKALEWVDTHFHETEVNDRWGESRYVVMSGHDLFKDDLLKDFKNYMKGE